MTEPPISGRDALAALNRMTERPASSPAEKRRQRMATAMALVGIVGALGVAVFMFRRPPEALVLADCRDAYARSPTAADSVLPDARFPATPNGKPWPTSCGTLRAAGRLAPQPK